METAFAGNNLHLLERYPELQFLLRYDEAFSESGGPLHSEDLSQEMARFFSRLHLESVDLLYVYGVGLGYHYDALKEWLQGKKDRRVIFLEDDLSAIQSLLHSQHAEALLFNPQVVLQFISANRDAELEALAFTYSCDRMEVVAIESYQKRKRRRFQQIKLKLLRQSAVAHALLTEALYGHKMLTNLVRNIKRWHGSFFAGGLKGKFRGIPAVICGAGPSLQASIPLLKELEDRALIIAGGSTIAALSNQGIHPHLGLALDPNPEEFGRLKAASSFEMPLIYATRLQPDVFNALSGERGYLISDTGGPCERYFEKQMQMDGDPIGPELGQEALSVTTLAIALAVEMGCNPILLDGIDLAYTGMRRYAEGILPSSSVVASEMRKQKKAPEQLLKRKDIHGHYVHTLVKWVMESDCIAAYAKAHPECRFINVSQGGIGFPGISNRPLPTVAEEELQERLDLRALVHAEIEQLKMAPLKDKIEHAMRAIAESLQRLGSIAEEMIEELERVQPLEVPLPSGKMAILEIDFQEEKAFECLFPTLGPALDKLLSRAFFLSPDHTEEEKRRLLIQSKIAKWKHWKEMIRAEIAVFQTW